MPAGMNRASWVRVLPFALYVALLAARGAAAGTAGIGFDPRWFYALTVLLVGGLLWS